MKLSDFKKHYNIVTNDKKKLQQEFKKLWEKDKTYPAVESNKGCNQDKNRFYNIVAYDHSRFSLSQLDGIIDSDYINANFIPGFNSNEEYIAAQGPLRKTVDDFWRMVWQSKASTIVVLTVVDESYDRRCYKYWPKVTTTSTYGDIEVENIIETIEKHNNTQEWLVTEFWIKFKEETRNLKHFQYLTWPDYEAVDPPEALVQFTKCVREHAPFRGDRTPPIIVHCSAGVGRTGTWIAIDIAMHQIKFKQKVNVSDIVKEMRKNRMWMVQTEEQYLSIYKAAFAYLEMLEKNKIPVK